VAPRPLAVPVASGRHLLAAPNPFNPQTELRFRLAEGGEVDLSLYNARGERVIRLADGWYPAGQHRVRWRGEDGRGRRVASGSYVARLGSGRDVQTVRLVLVK
jgi:hypothetical protein